MSRPPVRGGRGRRGRSGRPPRSRRRSRPAASRERGSGRRLGRGSRSAHAVLLGRWRHRAREPLASAVASDAQVRPSSGLTTEADVTDPFRPPALSPVRVAAIIVCHQPARRGRLWPLGECQRRPSAESSPTPDATSAAIATASPRTSPTPRPTTAADVAVQTVARRPGRTRLGWSPCPGDDDARAGPRTDRPDLAARSCRPGATTPFLDLRDRVVPLTPDYDERGLLGLAFHPDFASERAPVRLLRRAGPRRPRRPRQDHTNTLSPSSTSDPAHPETADPASRADGPPVRAAAVQPQRRRARVRAGRDALPRAPAMAAAKATRARAIRNRATPRTWRNSTARSCGSMSDGKTAVRHPRR